MNAVQTAWRVVLHDWAALRACMRTRASLLCVTRAAAVQRLLRVLRAAPSNMDNGSTREYLAKGLAQVIENLRQLEAASSVPMQRTCALPLRACLVG